jgi:hypothetical protein
MLTVIWGIAGFPVFDLMTEQHGYNTHYFLNNRMEPRLSALFPDVWSPAARTTPFHGVCFCR